MNDDYRPDASSSTMSEQQVKDLAEATAISFMEEKQALAERGEKLLASLADAKEDVITIAVRAIDAYQSMGIQYARALKDEKQREQNLIMLGRHIQDFKNRLDEASFQEWTAWQDLKKTMKI